MLRGPGGAEMAVFHNQNVQAAQVMQGETLHIRIATADDLVVDGELRRRFEDVRTRLDEAVADNVLPAADADEVGAALETVRAEVASSHPRRPRLEAALATVAGLTAGVSAAAGLSEAVNSLLGALGAS